ncbi:hypothetical protein, partial [Candidatus Phytoplasma pruni]
YQKCFITPLTSLPNVQNENDNKNEQEYIQKMTAWKKNCLFQPESFCTGEELKDLLGSQTRILYDISGQPHVYEFNDQEIMQYWQLDGELLGMCEYDPLWQMDFLSLDKPPQIPSHFPSFYQNKYYGITQIANYNPEQQPNKYYDDNE